MDESPEGLDVLEHKFGVPRELHAALRKSIAGPTCAGRFDFAFDGAAVHCMEYNADSSSALEEAAVTQQKMAVHYGFDSVGVSAGAGLTEHLDKYWAGIAKDAKFRPANGIVHFLIDADDEERYTALCMMRSVERAGLRAKLYVGFDDFRVSEGIVDADGDRVCMAWKTWSWDTVLRQHAEGVKPRVEGGVTLEMMLLCDDIMVLEPFWKYVAGSKGVLPYVWDAVGASIPSLLPSYFDLRDDIRHSYVRKPVSGRAGQNITVHDDTSGHDDEVVTPGRFSQSLMVYQAKVNLTQYDSFYPIFGAWVVDGKFAGLTVREDASKITTLDSVVAPARVV
jgi:glutathionylspermidine synthase